MMIALGNPIMITNLDTFYNIKNNYEGLRNSPLSEETISEFGITIKTYRDLYNEDLTYDYTLFGQNVKIPQILFREIYADDGTAYKYYVNKELLDRYRNDKDSRELSVKKEIIRSFIRDYITIYRKSKMVNITGLNIDDLSKNLNRAKYKDLYEWAHKIVQEYPKESAFVFGTISSGYIAKLDTFNEVMKSLGVA